MRGDASVLVSHDETRTDSSVGPHWTASAEVSVSEFEASASLIGYLYQCRFALVDAVRRLKVDPVFTVSLETLDDVVFETEGKPVELLQTKHRVNRVADLSDASTDLWKTLRIWCEGLLSGDIPPDAALFLMTTGQVEARSAAAKLLYIGERDEGAARLVLDTVARTSQNAANRKAYDAYRALTDDQRQRLLARVSICDRRDNILDLRKVLANELGFPVERKLLDSYMNRLEGWWFKRAISHLTINRTPILSQELEDEVRSLRNQFGPDNLPIDSDIRAATPDVAAFRHHVFVQQLQLVNIRNRRIVQAISDYYRAREQRSRWIREDLLLVGEVDDYEQDLTEAWSRHFERMADELGEAPAEEEKVRAGRAVFAWAEELQKPIRRDVATQFVTIGSFHMLADRRRVGWHPEFAARLRQLLGEEP